MPLTPSKKRILDYLSTYTSKNEYSPSIPEIATYFSLANSTVHQHLNELEKDGYLNRKKFKKRSVGINSFSNGNSSFFVPILGSANAGEAVILASEEKRGDLHIPSGVIKAKNGNLFALKIDGDSMNKAKINGRNIESGDFVIVDPSETSPENNDYVLSVINGCANVKKFKKDTNGIRLEPESTNKKHKPIYLSSEDDFMINGKIIAVVKK
jgi:repressor LexA